MVPIAVVYACMFSRAGCHWSFVSNVRRWAAGYEDYKQRTDLPTGSFLVLACENVYYVHLQIQKRTDLC